MPLPQLLPAPGLVPSAPGLAAHSGWVSSRSPPTASPSSVNSGCSISSPSSASASNTASILASMRSNCVGRGPLHSGGGGGALDSGGFTLTVPAPAYVWDRTANLRGLLHRTLRLQCKKPRRVPRLRFLWTSAVHLERMVPALIRNATPHATTLIMSRRRNIGSSISFAAW